MKTIKALLSIILFFFYGVIWHYTIIASVPYSFFEMHGPFVAQIYQYGLLAFILSTLVLFCRGRYFFWGTVTLFSTSVIIRLFDWNIFFFHGFHIDQLFWQFSMGSALFWGMIFSKPFLLSFVVSIAMWVIGFYFLKYLESFKREIVGTKAILSVTLLPLIIWATFLALCEKTSSGAFISRKSRHVAARKYISHVPEVEVIKSFFAYLGNHLDLSDSDLPNKDFSLELAKRGIRVNSISEKFPLRKESIFLDGKSKNPFTLPKGTNVIMVVAESYSSYFIDRKEASPHLNQLLRGSTRFDLINGATPTYHGTVGIMSSMLNMFSTTLHRKRKVHPDVGHLFDFPDANGRTRYEWISDILKERGYENYYINGLHGEFANFEDNLRRHSFDHIVNDSNPLLKKMAIRKRGHWGYSDHDVFSFAVETLKDRKSDAPMFMVVDSGDLHHPYSCPRETSDRVLDCAFSTDNAFGKLWDYYRTSRYAKNTLLIFTADHALFPTKAYLNLRSDFKDLYYDFIPLIIRIPGHKGSRRSNVVGSSLDIAPTLLDLLGYDAENSFLGLSLFSEREAYPMIWAMKNVSEEYGGMAWSDEEQRQFLRFLQYLSYSNRLVPGYRRASDDYPYQFKFD